MAAYGFYIVDPLENVARGDIPMVAAYLSRWLDPIVKQAGFDYSWVCFPQCIVTPQAHELMVYICSFEHSVAQFAPGGKGNIPDPRSSSHKGITLLGPPAASEVYIKESSPLLTAALIFHEAMHNKLQTNNTMHALFPPAALSAAEMTVNEAIAPTPQESSAMAKAMKKPVAQWSGGQQLLWNAVKKRDTKDPIWDVDLTIKY